MTIANLRADNLLLRAMRDADFELLHPSLTLVDYAKNDEFLVPEARIGFSWFPVSGIISVVAASAAGDQAEVGIVGREGMTAIATLLGMDWGMMHIFAQIGGRALRLPSAALRAAMSASPSLQALMLAYVHSFTVQTASAALAYATQTIEARLARWLMMSLDRLNTPDVSMTHEAFALMLGVRRAGVTVAIQSLEARGAIVGRRATVVVLDRSILAEIAGDSYGAAEASYARAVGMPLSQRVAA